jgi:hypothetical protein
MTAFRRNIALSPEDRDSMFLRNVGIYRLVYTALIPRRSSSTVCYVRPRPNLLVILLEITTGNISVMRGQIFRRYVEGEMLIIFAQIVTQNKVTWQRLRSVVLCDAFIMQPGSEIVRVPMCRM